MVEARHSKKGAPSFEEAPISHMLSETRRL